MSNDKTPDKRPSRLKMGGIGILTTLLYLWLAIRGSGGLAAFFRHPARTGVAVASVLMASAAFAERTANPVVAAFFSVLHLKWAAS